MPAPATTSRHARINACGFTVLELIVVIACIGVLVALLLPAVVYGRESARRVTCTSQLREIGIATHAYHDSHRKLPAGWIVEKADATFIRGWLTELLPELGESPVADTLNKSVDGKDQLSNLSLPLLVCPSDITEPTFELFSSTESWPEASTLLTSESLEHRKLRTLPTANYVGVFGTVEADEQGQPSAEPSDGSIVHDRRVRLADLERGATHTLLVGERTMSMVPSTWLGVDVVGEDSQCRLVGSAMTRPNCEECDECEFSSRHSGGSNFLWADGHVELMDENIETALYRQYSQRFVR